MSNASFKTGSSGTSNFINEMLLGNESFSHNLNKLQRNELQSEEHTDTMTNDRNNISVSLQAFNCSFNDNDAQLKIETIPSNRLEYLLSKFESEDAYLQQKHEVNCVKSEAMQANEECRLRECLMRRKSYLPSFRQSSPALILNDLSFHDSNIGFLECNSDRKIAGGCFPKTKTRKDGVNSENKLVDAFKTGILVNLNAESRKQEQKMCDWLNTRGRVLVERVKGKRIGPFKTFEDQLMPSSYGCGWIYCSKQPEFKKSKFKIKPFDPLVLKRSHGGIKHEKLLQNEDQSKF